MHLQATDDGPVPAPFDTPVSGNVLPNDTDPDGDPLSVTEFTVAGDPTVYPAGSTAVIDGVGTLVIGSDGGYTFTPLPGYVGPVPSAVYTVTDGQTTDTAVLSFADVAAPPLCARRDTSCPSASPSSGAGAGASSACAGCASVGERCRHAWCRHRRFSSPSTRRCMCCMRSMRPTTSATCLRRPLGGIQGDPALQGEALGQLPDSLIFSSPDRNLELGLIRERAFGEVQVIRPALHVQNAVRHQPIETDHALVRAACGALFPVGVGHPFCSGGCAELGDTRLLHLCSIRLRWVAPAPLGEDVKPGEAEAPAPEKPDQKAVSEQRDQSDKGVEQAAGQCTCQRAMQKSRDQHRVSVRSWSGCPKTALTAPVP